MKTERNPNQKAFKIVKKPVSAPRPKEQQPAPQVDPAEVKAFALSIAADMKRRQREADEAAHRQAVVTPENDRRKYSARELSVFERELFAARAQIVDGLGNLKDTASINDTDDVEPDGGDGTNQSMRLDTISHIENANKTITDIDEALHRISDGTYGICLTCGHLISKERLLQRPFAKACTDCQRELELAQANGNYAVEDDNPSCL